MAELTLWRAETAEELRLPYADDGVRAGFPSPAQDFLGRSIDLNRELVSHPESTFYARVVGDSLKDAGVVEGDLLVVDKSLEADDGDMAVCWVNGEFTLKFVEFHEDCVILRPANGMYEPLRLAEGDTFTVWGVVTYIIHKTQRRR